MQRLVPVGPLLTRNPSLPRPERSTRRSFNVGDMVLRRMQDDTGLHKLNSRWERSFIVHKVTEPGSYHLQARRFLIPEISSIYANVFTKGLPSSVFTKGLPSSLNVHDATDQTAETC
jgi:hypothetical protein